MKTRALLRTWHGKVRVYESIKEASEDAWIDVGAIERAIEKGKGWRWVKRVYAVQTKDGREVLSYADISGSKWWFPVDGSALRKKDTIAWKDVTEEYYLAREL